MADKINILFFLGDFQGNGGISRVTSVLCNELVNDPRYNIKCLCYCDRGLPFFYKLDNRITIDYWLDKPLSMTKAILSGKLASLTKYLIENKINIAIGCGTQYAFALGLIRKKTKSKVVCWDHTSPYQNSDFRFNKLINKHAVKFSDINVFLTDEAKRYYDGFVRPSKNLVINNPIDRNAFTTREYDVHSKKIISVGRLCFQKNYECLLEIARSVLTSNRDWIWDIYGDGELKEKLNKEINEMNLQNQLHLKGQVSNLYDIYSDYSFLVLTSRYEGMPMALLEGWANNLPLISFDIHTGPNEMIDNGVNGFLIPFEDKALMVKRINELIENPNLRMNMSNELKQNSSKFQISTIKEEWDELFSKI